LSAVDHKLGVLDPRRDPGPLDKLGPIQRQLRGLLWKQGLAVYNDPRLNAVELVDRLEERLQVNGRLPK
jgi:hypothetical protein